LVVENEALGPKDVSNELTFAVSASGIERRAMPDLDGIYLANKADLGKLEDT
jgi:hypothetical protein